MRFRTATPVATSACWVGNVRARSVGPINLLVAADGGLDEAAAAVARRLLPAHPAVLGNEPNVAVARARRVSSVGARHRRGARWNDDIRWRIGLLGPDGLVDRFAVVGAVGRNAGDLAFDLLEQDRNLAGVVGAVVGQRRSQRSHRCRRPRQRGVSAMTAAHGRASRRSTRLGRTT